MAAAMSPGRRRVFQRALDVITEKGGEISLLAFATLCRRVNVDVRALMPIYFNSNPLKAFEEDVMGGDDARVVEVVTVPLMLMNDADLIAVYTDWPRMLLDARQAYGRRRNLARQVAAAVNDCYTMADITTIVPGPTAWGFGTKLFKELMTVVERKVDAEYYTMLSRIVKLRAPQARTFDVRACITSEEQRMAMQTPCECRRYLNLCRKKEGGRAFEPDAIYELDMRDRIGGALEEAKGELAANWELFQSYFQECTARRKKTLRAGDIVQEASERRIAGAAGGAGGGVVEPYTPEPVTTRTYWRGLSAALQAQGLPDASVSAGDSDSDSGAYELLGEPSGPAVEMLRREKVMLAAKRRRFDGE